VGQKALLDSPGDLSVTLAAEIDERCDVITHSAISHAMLEEALLPIYFGPSLRLSIGIDYLT
jgi:hypothetical protein